MTRPLQDMAAFPQAVRTKDRREGGRAEDEHEHDAWQQSAVLARSVRSRADLRKDKDGRGRTETDGRTSDGRKSVRK